jgi:hypothetical protein
MKTFGTKYSPVGKLAAIFILMILTAPCLTALVDADGCCDEPTCCNYVSCDCNCHVAAGLVTNPGYSHVVSLTSYIGTAAGTLPTEDHPRLTDRPPRLTA